MKKNSCDSDSSFLCFLKSVKLRFVLDLCTCVFVKNCDNMALLFCTNINLKLKPSTNLITFLFIFQLLRLPIGFIILKCFITIFGKLLHAFGINFNLKGFNTTIHYLRILLYGCKIYFMFPKCKTMLVRLIVCKYL